MYCSNTPKLTVAALVVCAFSVSSVCAADFSYDQGKSNVDHDWSGIFAGAHIGGMVSDQDHVHQNVPGTPSSYETIKQTATSPRIGGHIGARVQRAHWVFGTELSLSYVNTEDTTKTVRAGTNRTRTLELENLLTATGQLGYAQDNWLGYVKGGYAGGSIRTHGANTTANIWGEDTKFESGWTAGLGAEYAFTEDLSFGLEYNFVSIEGTDRNIACHNAGCRVGFSDISLKSHDILGRLNWTFN